MKHDARCDAEAMRGEAVCVDSHIMVGVGVCQNADVAHDFLYVFSEEHIVFGSCFPLHAVLAKGLIRWDTDLPGASDNGESCLDWAQEGVARGTKGTPREVVLALVVPKADSERAYHSWGAQSLAVCQDDFPPIQEGEICRDETEGLSPPLGRDELCVRYLRPRVAGGPLATGVLL